MGWFYRLQDFFRNLPRGVLTGIAALAAMIVLLYYPIGMLLVHKVDDNPDFANAGKEVVGGSHAVSIMAALIDREVNQHHWTPNDPFFLPGAMLDRMPSFQRGIISGLSRFAVELADQIGRTRGSSQVDADLEKAAGLLKYSPTVWMFDFSTSWLPTASSEKQYRAAMKSLENYNQRLARKQAVFDKRADNLIEALNRIANDMGASSAAIDKHINDYSGTLLDTEADEIYYYIKGRMYAYYLLMRELEKDYADLIREKQLQSAWAQTLESLREGSQLSNFFIFNAAPGSQLLPNHLANQGFYLMRARTQMYEITNILLK